MQLRNQHRRRQPTRSLRSTQYLLPGHTDSPWLHFRPQLNIQQSTEGHILSAQIHCQKGLAILNLLLRHEQHRYSYDVFQAVQREAPMPIVRQLGIAVAADGLLICHSRHDPLDNTPAPLLHCRSNLSKLIIEHIHQQSHHPGTAQTLAQLTTTMWTPQGRAPTKSALRSCVTCHRHKGPSFSKPAMPQPPKERVQRSESFQFTGLYILGPLLFSTEGSQPNKLWVCLFTCLSTRTIHLEWMDDMTTDTFLDCLRRFISRRGCPTKILSDNAPQFKVASTILNNRWAKIVRDQQAAAFSQHHNVQWKFTTEYAPWMGGIYEGMVGRVKRSLRKTIGRQLLTKPKLITLRTEIEATINSRPLTYVAGEEDFRHYHHTSSFPECKSSFYNANS